MILRVIHESHDADGTGSQAKVFLHVIVIRKGKSCGVDLLGENFCLKFLMSRHQKKIELCLLGIAEKKVLADMDPKNLIGAGTGIDRECRLVVEAGIGDI